MNRSKVGEKIVELISPIIEVSLMQAEVDKFPYCAYEIDAEVPQRSKAGILGYKTDLSIYIVAKTESQAAEIAERITSVLPRNNTWDFALQNKTPATDSGHWMYKLEYSVTQIL